MDWEMAPFVLLLLLAFGLLLVWVGYLAYAARVTRERLARQPPFDPKAPLRELAQVNEQLAAEMQATRALLAKTREAVRHGVKG